MKISSILFRYISWSFIKCFLIVVLCFLFITAMLESMEIVRRFANNQSIVSYKTIIELTVLNSIITVSSFFPFTAFLGTILFFTNMHSKLELTVIKVCGVSIKEIVKCLLFSVSLIGTVYITVFDGLSVYSINRIKSVESKLTKFNSKTDDGITVTNQGIWFKDASESKSFVIYAKSFYKNSLLNVRFFEFNKNDDFVSSFYAESAYIEDKSWKLDNVKIIGVDGVETKQSKVIIPTLLSFGGISQMTTNPKGISFWSLSKYISTLEKVGLSSTKYRVHWYLKLSSIFQMMALVMLVSVFCMNYNPRNTKKYALRIAVLLTIAFPIHFTNNILIAFGENGDIPIFVAVFSVSFITIISSYFYFFKKSL